MTRTGPQPSTLLPRRASPDIPTPTSPVARNMRPGGGPSRREVGHKPTRQREAGGITTTADAATEGSPAADVGEVVAGAMMRKVNSSAAGIWFHQWRLSQR